jgi:DNA repair protein RadC
VIGLQAPDLAPEMAERLMTRFGSMPAVLAARPEDRAATIGAAPVARLFELLIRAMRHTLRYQAAAKPILSDPGALVAYLSLDQKWASSEWLRVLLLNARNELLGEEIVFPGTVNKVQVYPREVAKRALGTDATAVLLVHNHPSGDPTPSQADIDLTKRIAAAVRAVDIRLHDHLIISRNGTISLRAGGYLTSLEKI